MITWLQVWDFCSSAFILTTFLPPTSDSRISLIWLKTLMNWNGESAAHMRESAAHMGESAAHMGESAAHRGESAAHMGSCCFQFRCHSELMKHDSRHSRHQPLRCVQAKVIDATFDRKSMRCGLRKLARLWNKENTAFMVECTRSSLRRTLFLPRNLISVDEMLMMTNAKDMKRWGQQKR